MKHYSFAAAIAAASLVVTPASAEVITIDFENVSSFAPVAEYYSGGTDGAGLSGVDLGVEFGLDVLAFRNDELGPYFGNAPSGDTVMAAVGPLAVLNFATGFLQGSSFSYSSYAPLGVGVYSGLNGTGLRLGEFLLTENAESGCTGSPFCNWTLAIANFTGVGRSVMFGDAVGVAAFDNVTLVPNQVSEPAQMLMLGTGLFALAGMARRSRRTPKAV